MVDLNTLIVTGGAGFIGSALVRHLIENTDQRVVVLDKLTYAGNLESLAPVLKSARLIFQKGDIADRELVSQLLRTYRPRGVFNLAAESHVDRSIDGPSEFIQTNIVGTFNLLECCLEYWASIGKDERFRFQHISTDEVFGSLGASGAFSEDSRYEPNSPYSASKASSDHLVRAWNHTYSLPVLLTNCSNNYGPYHYPEKLIPLVIRNALAGKPLPVYGDGLQVRDWLYVDDHVRALVRIFEAGVPGDTYNVGGDCERTNIAVVRTICDVLQDLAPRTQPYADLITHVPDRPGHDRRYAINCSKLKTRLGWTQTETFETGIRKTIQWYLANQDWVRAVLENKYDGQRLGGGR